MRAQLDSVLGKLAVYRKVDMELELKGSHHRDLLQGNPQQYERVASSVIQDLLGPKYDVYAMSLAELYYLFFMAKANTFGPTWQFPWECPHIITKTGTETRCGHKNTSTYNLSKMTPVELSNDFVVPSYELTLESTGKIQVESPRSITVKLRPLPLSGEFEALDSLMSEGFPRERILKEKSYELIVARVVRALVSDDEAFSVASPSDRLAVLDNNSSKIKAAMMRDLGAYDRLGYPLRLVDTCKGCAREVTLQLPFLAGIVVYE